MTRLFRQKNAGASGYAALGLFGAAYLAALAIVIAPQQVWHGTGRPPAAAQGEKP